MRRIPVLFAALLPMAFPLFCEGAGKLMDEADRQFRQENYLDAAELYNDCVDEYIMNEELAERARFMEAESYYLGGKLSKAYKLYEDYLRDYPSSKRFEDVLGREYQIGAEFCSGHKRSFMWMDIVPSGGLGVEVLEQVIRHAPRGEYGDKALLRIAYYYDKTKDYEEARRRYTMLVDEYPDSKFAPEARLLRAQASRKGITGARYNADGLEEAKKELLEAKNIDKGGETEHKIDTVLERLREEQLESDYETAKFYLRQGYPEAAAMCLKQLIKKAPESRYARYSKAALKVLQAGGVK